MDPTTLNTPQEYKKDDKHDDQTGVISMHEFLDFLKLTCQVNETLDNNGNNGGSSDKKCVDYDQLAKNELVNMLLSKNRTTSSPGKSTKECTGAGGCGKLGAGENSIDKKCGAKSLTKKRSIRRSREGSETKVPLDPALNEKLDEVINEGILDSVLPFICPTVCPPSVAPVQHTCNNKPKLSSTTLVLNGGAGAMANTKPSDNSLKIMQDYPMGKKSDSNLLVPTRANSKDRFPRRKVSIQSSTSNASMAEYVIFH